jgi:D-sedoheptulose 7-phosphate isomerase
MDLVKFYDSEFAEHEAVLNATAVSVREPFERLVAACVRSLNAGGKLMFFGNGGSAADAQHLATELSVRYKTDRAAIAALALTTDTSALTAIGNDLGFEVLFARQIEALAKPGDVAIAISTSGQSENIIAALSKSREMGVVAAGLSGRDGGRMVEVADPLIIVPSIVTARIQEMHIMLGQMLCNAIEIEMGLAPEA